VLPPGVTVPLHSHDDAEDFFVLVGTQQVLIQGAHGPAMGRCSRRRLRARPGWHPTRPPQRLRRAGGRPRHHPPPGSAGSLGSRAACHRLTAAADARGHRAFRRRRRQLQFNAGHSRRECRGRDRKPQVRRRGMRLKPALSAPTSGSSPIGSTWAGESEIRHTQHDLLISGAHVVPLDPGDLRRATWSSATAGSPLSAPISCHGRPGARVMDARAASGHSSVRVLAAHLSASVSTEASRYKRLNPGCAV
jgi:hypothetical protein